MGSSWCVEPELNEIPALLAEGKDEDVEGIQTDGHAGGSTAQQQHFHQSCHLQRCKDWIWMRAIHTAEQQQAAETNRGTLLHGVPLAEH